MNTPGFIFGGTTGMTYEDVQRQRRIADQLTAGRNAPRNVGEGLTAIGNALAGRAINKRAEKRDEELRGQFNDQWGSLFGGSSSPYADAGGASAGGGAYTPPKPANTADMKYPTGQYGTAPQGNIDAASGMDMGAPVEMDLAGGINETAEALGMDPHDLATMISYETAGTFDPAKKGPTTQWGQHRGLIQFGEPQAEQYGVNWDDPMGSQLGADGAIVKYFKENGWKPGMGLMDAYSIINAGGPGRYNASDANNGGAPGTVADKVNNQMDGHRKKAAALLGGSFAPGPGTQVAQNGGMNMQTLAEVAGSPYASPGQKAMAQQMLQQQMQASDPQKQIAMQLQKAQLERAQFDLERDRSGGVANMPASIQEAQWRAREAGLQPGTPEYQSFVLNGGGDPATFRALDMQAQAAGFQQGSPEYAEFMATRGAGLQAGARTTAENQADIATGGQAARVVSAGSAQGSEEGKATAAGIAGAPGEIAQAQEGIALIDSIITDPALPSITGMVQGRLPPMGQGGTDLNVKIKQLQGKAFLEAFESLKGGGAITEREGLAAQNAMARLDRAQSTEAYVEALTELKTIMQRGRDRAAQRLGGAQQPPAPYDPQTPDFSQMSDEELQAYIERGGK